MAIYRCKMCGAQLEVEEGSTVATCDYCGSKQTVANADDERKEALYNRANDLRAHNEFDKAILAYQSILSIFPDEPEAHWGITLCRYGIEYVDDPVTKVKKPTIHRISFDSILKDSDYVAALAYADVVAREVYQEQAKEIADIQKNLLAISQKEEPFDIFICYKETGDNDKRTPDSVLAQEIYEALVERGYKVFFARITLENKLGTMYEPYIFAALNSAKIMLVIGTQKAYFDAVWVKNEWSRFLDLMKTRPDRYLIPCYKDMNAYDMPEEFLSLQAQNLAKLGFLQDLLRGIDKIMGKEAPRSVVQTNVVQADVNIKALLKRAEILIGDKDYQKADDLLERVLDNDPTNSQAYLLKLLIELKITSVEDLKLGAENYRENRTFKKAYDFGDEIQKKRLEAINDYIDQRNEKNRLESIYGKAKQHLEECRYEEAGRLFASISDYKDAKEKAAECEQLKKEAIYQSACDCMESGDFDKAITLFMKIPDHRDSKARAEKCPSLKEEARKEAIYQSCLFKNGINPNYPPSNLQEIIKKLGTISGYKNSHELYVQYTTILKNHQERMARKRAETVRQEQKRRRKKIIVTTSVLGAIAVTAISLVLTFCVFVPNNMLNEARKLVDAGQYSEALSVLYDYWTYFQHLPDSQDYSELEELCLAGKNFETGYYNVGIKYMLSITRTNPQGTVNVTYDPNGGSVDPSFQTFTTKDYDSNWDHKYITNTATKDSYTFDGWQVDSFTINRKEYSASLTLKALYSDIRYPITYHLDGGTNNAANPSSYTAKEKVVFADPAKTGYTFLGWFDNSNNQVTSIEVGNNEPIELTAHWNDGNKYTISLKPNGGVVSPASIVVQYDHDYTLPTPNKLDYSFDGWYFQGTLISNSGIWKHASDTTFIASWHPLQDDFSFDVDESTKTATVTGYHGNASTVRIPSIYQKNGINYTVATMKGGCICNDSSIVNLILPDTIQTIEEFAVSNCQNLVSVTIGSGVKEVGESGLFSACVRLTEVVNRSSLSRKWGPDAYVITDPADSKLEYTDDGFIFYNSETGISLVNYIGNKTSISIPEGVTEIRCYAFYYSSVTSVELPDGLTRIGDLAFAWANIETIIFPDTTIIIGYCAFHYCGSLKHIYIPNGVTQIWPYAFSYCSSLKSVFIPSSVTSMGASVFKGSGLTTIYCEATSRPSGWDYLWNSDNASVVWGATRDQAK